MNFIEHFEINSPTVVHELFDAEVVLIHMENGNYYTLDEGGAQIWAALVQGVSVSAMIANLVAKYGGNTDEIAKAIRQFLQKLQQEQLILPAPVQNSDLSNSSVQSNGYVNQPHSTFLPPTLRKYTDMQDLLLLDPIHDVEESGWPNAKRG